MHTSLQKLTFVKNKVNEIINKKQLKINPKIIVVTKTFSLDKITPLLKSGHMHFGENKIQEAENKWVQTIIDKARITADFQEKCTPGYYNNEGKINQKPQNGMYGGGPIEFFALMKKWRSKGNLEGLELTQQ